MAYNENTRVKIPATIQFLRLGYEYQSLDDDNVNIDFATRIFINRFKPSIEKINGKEFSDDEVKAIISDITDVIKNNDLGKEFYHWLIDPQDRVKLIDFDDIENNDLAVVDELPFMVSEETEEGSFRPDVNILVNGMPLAFLEVKPPNNEGGIQKEFDRMINKRLQNPEYRKFFNLIQMVTFSNNMEYVEEDCDDAEDVKAGSFYATPNGTNTEFSFFREDSELYHVEYSYADVSEDYIKYVMQDCNYAPSEVETPEFQENLSVMSPCNRFITSVFDKERFLYFLQYGLMYIDGRVPEKRIMRYPQFFATRKIIERLESGGKGGIIWHTQGSGKTDLTAFANRVIRDYYAEQDITTRFFFVVDRLELLTQASNEFTNCGLNVINCNSRADFAKELNKPLSINTGTKSIGEICVVNIQKFSDKFPLAKNDYNANVQRVFFVDEAHRSYAMAGEFFKNLMTCDTNGVFIALTGTPLLTRKERSNLKFGDYIHKYFYDKSIADGYTLRIKKENISTVAKTEIRNNLEIEGGDLNDSDVYESDTYVNNLCEFIEKDFNNFRLTNSDPHIGGMIVCRSNPQAKKVHEWFVKNSKLSTGLVMTDSDNPKQGLINKNNQINFKETDVPDILVVNIMLTTGYDVKRLKKMYLLRGPHAHTLLQTISRVNRPYKSPSGKTYKYGYIVDFVDIEQEYDRTLDAYVKELEAGFNDNGEDENSLAGLVIDKEDINKRYHKYADELEDIVPTDNLETFSKKITNFNKDALFRIRRLLNGIKECHTEFLLSQAYDYADQIAPDRIKQLSKATQDRINFINLSDDAVDMMSIISNDEVVEILYEFIKVKVTILDLGQFIPGNPHVEKFKQAVEDVQKEVKANKNKKDIKIKKLNEMLNKVFNDLSISDLSDLDNITEELLVALEEARKINAENERLSEQYGGNYAFVKTYQDAVEAYPVDRSDVERTLVTVYDAIKDTLDKEVITVQGKKNFIDSVKSKVTKGLIKEGLYKQIKDVYDQLLSSLYTNLQLIE